jgi:hypothetical protein
MGPQIQVQSATWNRAEDFKGKRKSPDLLGVTKESNPNITKFYSFTPR